MLLIMVILKNLIEKIMYNTYDFCCLCLKSFETDDLFNIADEVMLDNNITENMFYILSHVVQDTVFHNIVDTFGFICQHCTEAALQSYKFIRKCQGNVLKLFSIVKSLNNYFEYNQCGGDGEKIYAHSDIKIDIKLESYSKNENSSEIQLNNECISNNSVCDQVKCLVEYEFQRTGNGSPNVKPVKKESNVKSCSESKNDIIRDKSDLSVFKCKICKNNYSRGPNLKKHYLSVHAPKIYKCSLCHESFGSALLLKAHDKSRHTQGTAVCCIECGKVFKSMYALKNHERRHKTRLVCQHCGKVYKTKQSFKSHIDWMHGEQPKKVKPKFICDYCGKIYSQKSGLRLHIGFEHGHGKYYECEWCKKRLSSLSHLKEHILTHTKDKPFSCKVCGGRFSTKMSLLYHTRRHTGEKPYKCNHCDSSFISASRRLGHIKQHHLPPELQCDICLKEFKLKNCLRKHRLKHFNCKK